ncbi:hypothetical protein SLS64_010967 [Diaporthe eres]|uniref:Zinc-binding loop region of homing endonuclease domain-containing protein n=1 Tax=Diaporthe eres TaxID=83184 RepID=A0ABR1NN82_DIAER
MFSVLRSRGKRSFHEIEDTDSASKAAEWERVLERIKSHEKEMEQQRAQLEDTKRLIAEQKTRIDDLEQRRLAKEPLRGPDVRMRTAERDVAPPEAVPQDIATPAVAVPQHLAPPPDADAQVAAPRRVSSRQAQRREERRRRNASQVTSQRARARQKKRERQRLEQERQEDLELEQQLEQEQRREAERQERRLQRETRRQQNESQPAPAQTEAQMEADAQTRIQHEIFTRPLSGHNPRIIFDDDDRPHISEATAFLMRLPQAFVMAKLRKLVEGKAFFDVAHPGSVHMGCWVVSSKRSSCDMRMKLSDSGEKHGFSFPRLAVRLWHDEQSIYSLLQHHKHRQKAVHTCHIETCMRPDHIVVEPSSAAAERRRCKREGWCPGHEFVHKDGSRQARKPCIFPPQNAFLRR